MLLKQGVLMLAGKKIYIYLFHSKRGFDVQIKSGISELFGTEKVCDSGFTDWQFNQLEAVASDILGTRIDDMGNTWLYRIPLHHQSFGHYIDVHVKSARFTKPLILD